MVRFVNKSHAKSQSDYKDDQWFQNGFNKIRNFVVESAGAPSTNDL